MESINLVANSATGATAKKLNHVDPFFSSPGTSKPQVIYKI